MEDDGDDDIDEAMLMRAYQEIITASKLNTTNFICFNVTDIIVCITYCHIDAKEIWGRTGIQRD